MKFEVTPIGIIRTPYRKEAPVQAAFSDAKGILKVFDEYKNGLFGIDGFSHLILVYLFHMNRYHSLKVKPFLDDGMKGVFATRSPSRPNHLGISTVELLERKENVLTVRGVDMLDLTPILDIKPYVPAFDHRRNSRIGWLEGKV